MLHIVSLCSFLGFVLAGLAVVWSQRVGQTARIHRCMVTIFLLYCLAVSFGAGLTLRNAWPFSHWALISALVPPTIVAPRVMAVDRHGMEHDIDHRAWQPLPYGELMAWFEKTFAQLDHAAQDQVGHYLLTLAERARIRAHAGARVGSFERLLGPFTAPLFHLRPAVWSRPERVPPTPFVGLKVYKERWDWQERMRQPEQSTRLLVYEYRQP